MDLSLKWMLKIEGVTEETLKVLTKEKITSLPIFQSLKKQHFSKLLSTTKIKVGQHALLLSVWERKRDMEVSYFVEKTFNNNDGIYLCLCYS